MNKKAGASGGGVTAQYFDEHFSAGDYHDQSGKTPGVWHGKGAELLGLQGVASREDFVALTENINPKTGETLTLRLNTTRGEGEANRRAFFDTGFHPDKSISVEAFVLAPPEKKAAIVEAHNKSVQHAMTTVMEPAAAYNVRSKADLAAGKTGETGNLLMAIFQHDTSRAVEAGAAPDPQLHSHCVVMNATWDEEGKCWRALNADEMHQRQALAAAAYEHHLWQELHKLGYTARTGEKGQKHLAHISDELMDKFSSRNKQIKEAAAAKLEELKAQGIEGLDLKQIESNTANFNRVKKDPNLSPEELQADWKSRLTAAEMQLKPPPVEERNYVLERTGEEVINWTKLHMFERNAVVSRNEFLKTAINFASGTSVSSKEIEEAFRADKEIVYGDQGKISTKLTLEREDFCVRSVKEGKEKYEAFAEGLLPSAHYLNEQQRAAGERILTSKDFCTVFRGGAGTGKSTALKEIKEAMDQVQAAIEATGRTVHVIAPQNRQAQELEKDGLGAAKTVSKFLTIKDVEPVRDSVIICDEAGQLSGKDMAELIAKAKLANARIILSGDIRQHTSVGASDALRGICKFAAPRIAELAGEEAIMRQKVGWYKKAVYAADQGKAGVAFDMLDVQGKIMEFPAELRHSAAAALAEQISKPKEIEGKMKSASTLVLSQTNEEVNALNKAIREQRIKDGILDKKTEKKVETLQALKPTDAQKQLAGTYNEQTVLVPNQGRLAGFKQGDTATFVREGKGGSIFVLVAGKREVEVKAEDLSKLTVCKKQDLDFCRGDQIQLKANLQVSKGVKLTNGSIYLFDRVDEMGCVIAKDDKGKEFNLRDFRQFKHGYAVTSYGGQGMTVDHVIINDSGNKMATNQLEFYVSISRGRDGISILTSDKAGLRKNVQRSGKRELAMEMVEEKKEADSAAAPYLVPAVSADKVTATQETVQTPAAPAAEVKEPAPPYLVPAVSQETEEKEAIQGNTPETRLAPAVQVEEESKSEAPVKEAVEDIPSNVIPFPPTQKDENPVENVEVAGDVEDKPIEITEKSIEEAKKLIQAQQPAEHHLDIGQKIQSLLPKVPGFCMVFKGAGQVIQRASSAVKEMGQQVQEKVAQIFR